MKDIRLAFDLFAEKNVLIIGDIMVDSYIWGDVNRISPEAPVPVLSCSKRDNRLGGAANVALNIKSLGAHPILCSVVGNDQTATILISLLEELNGISAQGIIVVDDRPTTRKTRIISNKQQLMRIDDENEAPISQASEAVLLQKVAEILNSQTIDAVIFEDYDKGVISESLIKTVTAWCRDRKIPTLADPKHRNFAAYKNLNIFKPNLKEFKAGSKYKKNEFDLELLKSVADSYRLANEIDNLVITLSEYGVLLSANESYHIPAHLRDISDVSGAGDTVISVLTLCITANLDVLKAVKVANIAGGIVCEKSGIVPIQLPELLAECERLL